MYKSILVPLDGSAFSEYALPVAVPLARACGARIHLVHVRTDLSWLALTDERHDPERIYLRGVLARVRAADVEAREAVLEDELGDVMPAGRPFRIVAELLNDYIQRHNINLIVMTTHGRGGLKRGWLGSVADSLIRDTHVPVLTVRPPSKHAPPDERAERPILGITCPLDGSTLAEAALEPAVQLAHATDAHLNLVRVVEPFVEPANPYVHWVLPSNSALMHSQRAEATKYLAAVAGRVRARVRSITHRVVTGSAASAIVRTARRNGSNMIVMATHGAGGATRLFMGSVADRVIRSSDIPVLTIHASETTSDTACDVEANDVLAELGVPAYGSETVSRSRSKAPGHA